MYKQICYAVQISREKSIIMLQKGQFYVFVYSCKHKKFTLLAKVQFCCLKLSERKAAVKGGVKNP